MFCPKCGTPDQSALSYCRSCGTYLPDLTAAKPEIPADHHIKANFVLSAMTFVACFAMSAALFAVFGVGEGTHFLIYLTAGLLIAVGCWNVQTFWRTALLRKQINKLTPPRLEEREPRSLASPAESEMPVPASVVDRTTRRLERS